MSNPPKIYKRGILYHRKYPQKILTNELVVPSVHLKKLTSFKLASSSTYKIACNASARQNSKLNLKTRKKAIFLTCERGPRLMLRIFI